MTRPNINTAYNSIVNNTDKYYVYVGKPDKNYTPVNWQDSVVMLKRVVASDVVYSIIRNDWNYGEVYTQYNYTDYTSKVLKGKNFYASVLTNGVYKVYKCINNNIGSPSTISPSTINRNGMVTLSDGYVWMYMYQFSINQYKKFATLSYIPCFDDTSVSHYSTPTTIDNIQISNRGYGYTTCVAIIAGDGSGATASVELSTGNISRINVTNSGIGYTNASISFVGDGAGASASVVIAPNGGQGFSAKEELYSEFLSLSTDISTNSDYDILPYDTTYSTYGLLKNINYTNRLGDLLVDYVYIGNSGHGYRLENKPTISFSGGFDSEQVDTPTTIDATAYPSMSESGLATVVLTNNGQNYRASPTMSISGGNGSSIETTTIMKSIAIANYTELLLSDVKLKFRQYEHIKQGDTTAQILFHDVDKSRIGVYNVTGVFIKDSLIEGMSSGANGITISDNFNINHAASFDVSHLVEEYNNSTITRQTDQPERITITLAF